MVEFDRFVAVVNPVSSQAAQALPRIDNLREHYPKAGYVQIDTSIEFERTIEDIANKVEPGDVCLIAGGDGTIHHTMLALLTSSGDAPMLPLWAGNGNDLAHMLNGNRPLIRNTHELLKNGETVTINPIELSFSGLQTELALCYAGFGMMAEGARQANDAAYRTKRGYHWRPVRALHEARALGPLPFTATPFTVTDEQGRPRQVRDVTFANGNRIAKYGHPPTELTKREFFHFELSREAASALWIGRLAMGTPVGEYVRMGDTYNFRIEDDVLAHVDAEPFAVPAGTAVRVSTHALPVQAVATRRQLLGSN